MSASKRSRESRPPAGATMVEPVQGLDSSGGLYLVRSRGSLHLFDLDAEAYLRVPGERSNAFPHDLSVLRLTRIERWPQIGEPFFIWLDDPREFAVWDYWRQSSTISAVYRVARANVNGGTGASSGYVDADGARHDEAPAAPAHSPRTRGQESPEELLPGLRVELGSAWTIVMSSADPDVDLDGELTAFPPVLEWPLRRDSDWETRLALYESTAGDSMRLRLDVLPDPPAGPRSTTGIAWIGLIAGPSPTKAPGLPPAPG